MNFVFVFFIFSPSTYRIYMDKELHKREWYVTILRFLLLYSGKSRRKYIMHMIGFVLPNCIRYWYSMGATVCTTTNGIRTEVVKTTCPHCPDTSRGIQEKNRVVRMLQAGVFSKPDHGAWPGQCWTNSHKTQDDAVDI